MARRDLLHDSAKHALQKDGWLITHDPYILPFGLSVVEIDLGAERLIAAERGAERIAVEVKSFLADSTLYEFHAALGQYLNYRVVLKTTDAERQLFLAVSEGVFASFFAQPVVQTILGEYQVRLLVFDPKNEQVRQWTK
jgi:hypothetical protein